MGFAPDGTPAGCDTLEEEEEKSRFFARLQAEGSSPLDYSRLLGELDSTGSTSGRKLGYLKPLSLLTPSVRPSHGFGGNDGDVGCKQLTATQTVNCFYWIHLMFVNEVL